MLSFMTLPYLTKLFITITIVKSKLPCTTEEGLQYLDELKASAFGKFLLKNSGLVYNLLFSFL